MRPHYFFIIIIIIIKKDWQCKALRGRLTPYQSEDTNPTLPTYREKEEKWKKVNTKKDRNVIPLYLEILVLRSTFSKTSFYCQITVYALGINQIIFSDIICLSPVSALRCTQKRSDQAAFFAYL